jgi:hypothetical protein
MTRHLTHWGFYACTLAPLPIGVTMAAPQLTHYTLRTERLAEEDLCPRCVTFAAFCAANRWARSALFTLHTRITRRKPSEVRNEALRLARLRTLQHIRTRLENGG